MSEELAHHEITYGNILNEQDIQNKKYELKARRLANEKIISLEGIIEAFLQGIHNLYELANFLKLQKVLYYKVLNIINKNMVIPLVVVNMLFSSNHYECLNIKI